MFYKQDADLESISGSGISNCTRETSPPPECITRYIAGAASQLSGNYVIASRKWNDVDGRLSAEFLRLRFQNPIYSCSHKKIAIKFLIKTAVPSILFTFGEINRSFTDKSKIQCPFNFLMQMIREKNLLISA